MSAFPQTVGCLCLIGALRLGTHSSQRSAFALPSPYVLLTVLPFAVSRLVSPCVEDWFFFVFRSFSRVFFFFVRPIPSASSHSVFPTCWKAPPPRPPHLPSLGFNTSSIVFLRVSMLFPAPIGREAISSFHFLVSCSLSNAFFRDFCTSETGPLCSRPCPSYLSPPFNVPLRLFKIACGSYLISYLFFMALFFFLTGRRLPLSTLFLLSDRCHTCDVLQSPHLSNVVPSLYSSRLPNQIVSDPFRLHFPFQPLLVVGGTVVWHSFFFISPSFCVCRFFPRSPQPLIFSCSVRSPTFASFASIRTCCFFSDLLPPLVFRFHGLNWLPDSLLTFFQ